MGRAPCCEKDSVKRGPWTPEEDAKLLACIAQHGTGSWRTLPKKAGLQRCGKSCRLRWTNYLRPDLKHGRFTDHEEQLIVKLHAALGSRWSLIAAQLPGRTDNDVKNYWNTRLKKKLCEMGIDPITHKPISQLLADLAGSIAIPKGGQIAEAALGCFKDDMLNVLMRKRPDWQLEGSCSQQAAPQQLLRGSNARQQQHWDPLSTTSSMPPILSKDIESVALHKATKQGSSSKLPVLPSATSLVEDIQQQQLKERPDMAPDMLLMRGPSCFTPDICMSGGYYDPRPGNFVGYKPAAAAAWTENDMLHVPSTSLGLHVQQPQQQQQQQQQQEQQQVYNNFFGPQAARREESSPSSQVPESGEAQAPWSPSASGSSCSSTTLADASVLEGVLSSDVPLWDFSELSSIISQ